MFSTLALVLFLQALPTLFRSRDSLILNPTDYCLKLSSEELEKEFRTKVYKHKGISESEFDYMVSHLVSDIGWKLDPRPDGVSQDDFLSRETCSKAAKITISSQEIPSRTGNRFLNILVYVRVNGDLKLVGSGSGVEASLHSIVDKFIEDHSCPR